MNDRAMPPRSILFINRVYPPVPGGTGAILATLAVALAREGWQVTVVTSRTDASQPRTETREGVRVEGVRGLPFTRANHWKRALGYLSLYPALFWRAWRLPRTDILVTITDPPLQLTLGPFLKWLKGGKLIHWAQDIYPELAEKLGVLHPGGLPARLLRKLSTAALRRHDAILTPGRCMKSHLEGRGLPSEKIQVMPNWPLQPPWQPGAEDGGEFRKTHGLENRFVVMYSGNLGLGHPFEAIVEAAEQLENKLPNVMFVFVGDGPRLAWLKERTGRSRNVRFLPFQPLAELPLSLRAADVHLASMQEDLCGLLVPSKAYGGVAAGRPCIFLGPAECETALFLREQGCGLALPANNGAALAECLARLATRPEELSRLQQRAEAIAPELTVERARQIFLQVLQKL